METLRPGELAADEDLPSPLNPRWPWVAGTTLSVIGLGLAGYLTYERYTSSTTLNCPAGGGIVDCLKVTTSHYATMHGLPVVILGLGFFAVMMGLQSRRAWASTSPAVRAGRVLWSVAGVGTALWLVYAELFKLGAICLWCTAVHLVSVLLFGLTAFGTAVTAVTENLAPAGTDDSA
jgi:uncharacterized membrane protein